MVARINKTNNMYSTGTSFTLHWTQNLGHERYAGEARKWFEESGMQYYAVNRVIEQKWAGKLLAVAQTDKIV